MKNSVDLLDALHRNGVIIERYRRAGMSIHGNPDPAFPSVANVLFINRLYAVEHGHSRTSIIAEEIKGERDSSLVNLPIRVVAKFAYYQDGYEEILPVASYLILVSNHPALPILGNVEAAQLIDAGVEIPATPTYERWVQDGRKCFRGVGR